MLFRETLALYGFALAKIPLIAFCAPRVVRLDDEGCEVLVPLSFRTKNHWGAMYFGALCTGADVAGGLNALTLIRASHPRVSVLFKDFEARFTKRADGDVVFSCADGRAVRAGVERAEATKERVTVPVSVTATVPRKAGAEPVAHFRLSLSLKVS